MRLILETEDREEYLKSSPVVDFDAPAVIGLVRVFEGAGRDETGTARKVYEYVRDQISHSWDIQARDVTCSASEVLLRKHGNCCGKSHLLAAIFRGLGIPAGFCYQWLTADETDPRIIIHGLTAVYLKSLDKWVRLDARGNKPGVHAEFSVDREILAWPVRPELGESDDPAIYSSPLGEVVRLLKENKTRKEITENWRRYSRPG